MPDIDILEGMVTKRKYMQIWICQLLYTDAIGCRLNGLAIRRRSVASCKKGHSFQPCTRSLTKEINTKTNWRQLAARRL